MADLKNNLSLPISLNENDMLEFHDPMASINPKHRTLAEMKDYLADAKASFPGESVYDMYRSVHLPQDTEKFKNAGLRFDITVVHPGLLGREFSKTLGLFHPFKPGTAVRYPEIYEVVRGKALFLMQRMDDSFSQVLDCYSVEASEGQDVIFLPGYAHFLINTTDEILITSNWSGDNFESLYEPVARYHGAAYYVFKGTDGQPEFKPNKNYASVPELKKLRPKELSHFGLIFEQPAYLTGQKSPNMLQFLINPDLYLEELTVEKCYSEA